MFISFCVPYLLYLYQAVKFVVENGYLAVYLNESSTTVDNPILRISDDLCVAGIYLYLSTFPIGKKYILVSCFYIVDTVRYWWSICNIYASIGISCLFRY